MTAMCGISGLFRPGGLERGDEENVHRINATLLHRGPDDVGVWAHGPGGAVLAQRRLAIQDLSPAGAQPMHSASGRYSITFNGEIYNFHELRDALEAENRAPAWRGHSDTEVLLAAIEAYGIAEALKRLSGMFAFALFDHETGAFTLARDPFGEKPLYIGWLGGALVFASELKALRAHPDWRREIDRASITAFIRHGYIGAPATFHQAARKIGPGRFVTFARDQNPFEDGVETRYWNSLDEAREARARRFSGDKTAATGELDRLIHRSISRQMIADVPVGAFLSGGIDSSTIAAIMQAQRSSPIETFSLGFREEKFNEAPYAREVAAHLGTAHNEIVLSGQDALDLLGRMPDLYDEPFADPSQLPTFMIARYARTKVTVALSGDAGDELFAGYGRYHSLRKKWEGGLAGLAARVASRAYAGALLHGVARPAGMLGLARVAGYARLPLELELADMAQAFAAPDVTRAYDAKFTITNQAHRFVIGGEEPVDPLVGEIAAIEGWNALDRMTSLDAERYLTDDILVKVDRAAMANSLETRVPLLDKDIARLAWSMPDGLRLANGERKGLLKAVLSRYVPRALWDRPKRGFGIPVTEWLKGPLQPMAEDLFASERLMRHGILDPVLTRAIWDDFLTGGQRRTNLIWALFILQIYLARELDG